MKSGKINDKFEAIFISIESLIKFPESILLYFIVYLFS